MESLCFEIQPKVLAKFKLKNSCHYICALKILYTCMLAFLAIELHEIFAIFDIELFENKELVC